MSPTPFQRTIGRFCIPCCLLLFLAGCRANVSVKGEGHATTTARAVRQIVIRSADEDAARKVLYTMFADRPVLVKGVFMKNLLHLKNGELAFLHHPPKQEVIDDSHEGMPFVAFYVSEDKKLLIPSYEKNHYRDIKCEYINMNKMDNGDLSVNFRFIGFAD